VRRILLGVKDREFFLSAVLSYPERGKIEMGVSILR
jgi:hypothetical protein